MGAQGKDGVVATRASMLLCRQQIVDDMTRAGDKRWMMQQERVAAGNSKQQDLTTAGNKRRG
jgi:hypothetical protein